MKIINNPLTLFLLIINASALFYEIDEKNILEKKYIKDYIKNNLRGNSTKNQENNEKELKFPKNDKIHEKSKIKKIKKSAKASFEKEYPFNIEILNYISLYLCALLFISIIIEDNSNSNWNCNNCNYLCEDCKPFGDSLLVFLICMLFIIIFYVSTVLLVKAMGKKYIRYFSLINLFICQLIKSILSFTLSSKFYIIKVISISLCAFNLLGILIPNINFDKKAKNNNINIDINVEAKENDMNPINELAKKEIGQNHINDVLNAPIDNQFPEIVPENVPLLSSNELEKL